MIMKQKSTQTKIEILKIDEKIFLKEIFFNSTRKRGKKEEKKLKVCVGLGL